jgi:hypothetical protein
LQFADPLQPVKLWEYAVLVTNTDYDLEAMGQLHRDRAARWSLKGAEAVLRLRALRSSGDFADYWSYHVAQEYQRNHVALYADGNVVPVRGYTRPALRRVK